MKKLISLCVCVKNSLYKLANVATVFEFPRT